MDVSSASQALAAARDTAQLDITKSIKPPKIYRAWKVWSLLFCQVAQDSKSHSY